MVLYQVPFEKKVYVLHATEDIEIDSEKRKLLIAKAGEYQSDFLRGKLQWHPHRGHVTSRIGLTRSSKIYNCATFVKVLFEDVLRFRFEFGVSRMELSSVSFPKKQQKLERKDANGMWFSWSRKTPVVDPVKFALENDFLVIATILLQHDISVTDEHLKLVQTKINEIKEIKLFDIEFKKQKELTPRDKTKIDEMKPKIDKMQIKIQKMIQFATSSRVQSLKGKWRLNILLEDWEKMKNDLSQRVLLHWLVAHQHQEW